ncbi:TetR/AcrR family transcriptional regulator [Hoeflea sp. Naph1]|uniref:TetR/AcrR family transcriptional regulator n=1 Tax=Hoeflea sp. Naph1 TaxID=3388653 RepID=UPI00398F9710
MNVKVSPSRQKLIDGATRALLKDGVSGTTTRKIAEEAGVRLATLHYHFKNKDELLFAVLVEVTHALEIYLDDEVKPSKNINDCISELITAIWKLVKKTKDLQIIQIDLTMHAVRHQDKYWIAKQQYEGYVLQYQRILKESNSGLLSNDHLRVLAEFLLAGTDGILLQELASSSDARSQQLLERLIEAGQAAAKSLACIQNGGPPPTLRP